MNCILLGALIGVVGTIGVAVAALGVVYVWHFMHDGNIMPGGTVGG